MRCNFALLSHLPATAPGKLDVPLAGGLAYGCLHEFYSAHPDDAAAAAGLVAGMAIAAAGNVLHPLPGYVPGVVTRCAARSRARVGQSWGGTPDNCLFVLADDTLGPAACQRRCSTQRRSWRRCVIEGQGRMPELDLTASRRLVTRLPKNPGRTLLLLRIGAEPVPSAAETRWSVAVCAIRMHSPANAPGMPDLRHYIVAPALRPLRACAGDWSGTVTDAYSADTAVSGAVVPVPLRRPAADPGTGSLRPVANCAA